MEEFDFNNAQIVKIGNSFLSRSKVNTVVLPNSVTTIDYGFCTYANSLTYVELGENVTSIGGAFLYNSGVHKVLIVKSVIPPVVTEANYFLVNSGTTAIFVPDDSVEAYKSADVWSGFAGRIKPLSDYIV